MGELADRLARIVIRANSPDGNIAAEVRGADDIRVQFGRDGYRSYGEEGLGHQLSQLATIAWARYHRDYVEIVDAFLVNPVESDSDEDREYKARLDQLVSHGTSRQGLIEIRSRALVRWDITITPGALQRLGEQDFLDELRGGLTSVLAEHRMRMVLLRDEIYGTITDRLRTAGLRTSHAGP